MYSLFLAFINWLFGRKVQQTTVVPVAPALQPTLSPANVPVYDFSTQKTAWHSVRVLCDNAGLALDEKDLICACIYQESRFKNTAVNHNKNSQGVVLSTDWGICQVNDYYHIGPGKDFPNVAYVIGNPDRVVQWMITMYQHGLLKQWVSYSSGAYKQWLPETSPMWQLA